MGLEVWRRLNHVRDIVHEMNPSQCSKLGVWLWAFLWSCACVAWNSLCVCKKCHKSEFIPNAKFFFFFFLGVGGLLRYSDFVIKIWHRPTICCYSVILLLSLHSSLILPFSSVLYYQFGLIVCPHPFIRWSPLVEDTYWLSFPP